MSEAIILAGDPVYVQEGLASEAITPGHLVDYVLSGGDTGQFRKHPTASGNAAPMFAVESMTPDRSVATTAVDTPYADGETMRVAMCRPGDLVYAWVPASASAIVKGNFLVSNGDGTLKILAAQATNEGGSATYTIQTRQIVAIADQALDNSAVGTASRIKVRVI